MYDKHPNIKYADDCLVQSQILVNDRLIQDENTRRDAYNYARTQCRERVAAFIAGHECQEIEGENTTEFRLRVFVFTPDEFYKVVNAEADRVIRASRSFSLADMEWKR